jgi:uncharacterized protein (TIGR00661 family)
MRILYGVQATGNGHITRARSLAEEFLKAGVQVDYLFSGRPREQFFDMDIFGDWRCHRGLTFNYEAGRVNVVKTLQQNSLKTLLSDIRSVDLSCYDTIITDFEPITAWAAKTQGRECIGIGHQYAFFGEVPRRGDNLVSRTIMKYLAPASIHLGLHWHHFGQAILPPIAEVPEGEMPVDPNKIVVYLGFEAHEDIIQLLEPLNSHLFVVYGPYPNFQSFDHIQLKPLSRRGFQKDVATATGVICNAGFELASEAIQLGKKLLVKPLHGQMEQLSNAKALEELGLGATMNTLDTAAVRHWLDNFEAQRVIYPNVAGAIADWIVTSNFTDTDILDSTQKLADRLWANVSPPSFAHANFGQLSDNKVASSPKAA